MLVTDNGFGLFLTHSYDLIWCCNPNHWNSLEYGWILLIVIWLLVMISTETMKNDVGQYVASYGVIWCYTPLWPISNSTIYRSIQLYDDMIMGQQLRPMAARFLEHCCFQPNEFKATQLWLTPKSLFGCVWKFGIPWHTPKWSFSMGKWCWNKPSGLKHLIFGQMKHCTIAFLSMTLVLGPDRLPPLGVVYGCIS